MVFLLELDFSRYCKFNKLEEKYLVIFNINLLVTDLERYKICYIPVKRGSNMDTFKAQLRDGAYFI